MPDPGTELFDRAASFFSELQTELCRTLAEADGGARTFNSDAWQRPGGGGGVARVLEGGAVFEKAGVNWSNVDGELPEDVAAHMPGHGRTFRATGVSLVLHPQSPMVPTTHANFRCLTKGNALWFGGGADLTPYYLFEEDAVHFHQTCKEALQPFGDEYHPRFKKWCDEYFYLKHRKEPRGIGGIFYDDLNEQSPDAPVTWEQGFALMQQVGLQAGRQAGACRQCHAHITFLQIIHACINFDVACFHQPHP